MSMPLLWAYVLVLSNMQKITPTLFKILIFKVICFSVNPPFFFFVVVVPPSSRQTFRHPCLSLISFFCTGSGIVLVCVIFFYALTALWTYDINLSLNYHDMLGCAVYARVIGRWHIAIYSPCKYMQWRFVHCAMPICHAYPQDCKF